MMTQILILLKLLQSVTNKNPLTIIQDQIIQEDKRPFIHTNERGKIIAYELGFENEAYFSRFFKKSIGFSPGEFTKKKCTSKSMICAFFRQWNTFTLASL